MSVIHITVLIDNESSLKSILEATNEDIEDKRIPLIAKCNILQNELINMRI